MQPITRLTISNFQSLVDVDLPLGSVTVIVGHSDAGKTAVVRALECACFNDSGGEFISMFDGMEADQCDVVISTLDGELAWKRSKKTARYEVTTSGGMEEFKKMGRGQLPPEVVEFLGVREVTVDDKTTARLQFVHQHDAPFLVVDRGGVASARVIGTITGINIFANANKLADSDRKHKLHEIDILRARIDELSIQVSKIGDVETQVSLLAGLLTELEQLESMVVRNTSLGRLKLKSEEFDRESEWLQKSVAIDLDTPAEMLCLLSESMDTLSKYEEIRCRSVKLRQDTETLTYKQLDTSVVDAVQAELEEVRSELQMLQVLRGVSQGYRGLLEKRELGDVELNGLEKQLSDIEDEKERVEVDYPLCPWEKDLAGLSSVDYRCPYIKGL